MAQEIILLGHGSRRNNATDVGLAEVVRRLQQRVGDRLRVRLAGFEFTRPSLAEAVAAAADAGADRVTVVPYFLFGGREVRLKIPAELDELRRRHPGLDLRYADCLGPDPTMADVCADRVRELLESANWRRAVPGDSRLGLVVISRGSRASEADAGLRAITAMVAERLGITIFSHAQAEIGTPRLPEAARAVIAAGATAVAVQPYLVFPGSVLLDTVRPALEQVHREHPDVPVALTRILGIDERMLDLALARAKAAGQSNLASPGPSERRQIHPTMHDGVGEPRAPVAAVALPPVNVSVDESWSIGAPAHPTMNRRATIDKPRQRG